MCFAEFFGAAMKISDDRVAIDDRFTIESQNDPQHTVCAWMLRTHVQCEDALAGIEFLFVRDSQCAGGRLTLGNGFAGAPKLGIVDFSNIAVGTLGRR
jgi:hypothetical protein